MERLHRYTHEGKRYVIDTETCFCFECDDISWDVLAHYPHTPANRIYHLLAKQHDPNELAEVVGELEWLRATKAILPAPKHEEDLKRFTLTKGLHTVSVRLPESRETPGWLSRTKPQAAKGPFLLHAGRLLLARSGGQRQLRLEIQGTLKALEAARSEAVELLNLAVLAGKKLVVAFGVAGKEGDFDGHSLTVVAEATSEADLDSALQSLGKAGTTRAARLGKHLGAGRVVLTPGKGSLKDAVAALEKGGVRTIELDLDSAFSSGDGAALEAAFQGLHETAQYYAKRLRENHYFRLEPLAGLFKRIYEGTPISRHDPAGVNALAVDADASIYPAPALMGKTSTCLGNLHDGVIDEARLAAYDDLGVLTTPACLRCWARHLCGGGTAGVHLALGGDVRRPSPMWCDGQRAWLEASVAAFNLLSVAGVNFTRIHDRLAPSGRPSVFTMVKAAMNMRLSLRAIEESDAALLTKWENWNESAYFLTHESSMFMATQYDREMDALHPRPFEQESMLTRRNGDPVGLMRIRPAHFPDSATLWLYFRDPSLYAAESMRKSFRFLLEQAGQGQTLRRVVVPVGPKENGLADFLTAAGFEAAGTQEEALYLHGRYHPLRIYAMTLRPTDA